MPLLRLIRDRTKRDAWVFDVIQASNVVMTITLQETPVPTSPGFRWRVALSFPSIPSAAVTCLALTVEAAVNAAATALMDAEPRGRLPRFTSQEWALIQAELQRQGFFEPA
jgi:hypothetical protein